jgi:hypothetical protein
MITLVLVRTAYSAPSISSSATTLNNGQYISISGSEFGAGDNTPSLWDNFENGSTGSRLNAQPLVGSWVHISDPTPTIYSNNYAHSGTKSAYTPNSSKAGNIRVNNLESASRIYWSFWFRYNNNDCSGCQTKLIQLWGNGSDQCDYGPGFMSGGFSGSWFASYNIASGNDCSTGKVQMSYGHTPSQNNWHFAEVILERSSNYGVSDGTIIMRIDNRDAYSRIGNSLTRTNSQDWRSALFFYGFTNNSGLGNFSIDDAYLNNSWSRVMLGNASQYSNCTKLDVQPVVSWTNSSIKATFNAGDYSTGQTAYLYVIDSNGNISNSHQITIGQALGSSNDSTEDNAPTVVINSPTSNNTYTVNTNQIDITGSTSDDYGVVNVTWSNNHGDSGTALDNSGSWSSFSLQDVSLQEGSNIITVTATDTEGQTATDTLTVTYSTLASTGTVDESYAWNAFSQTGDTSWTDSSVTYCVRLLVEGDQITGNANQVRLGFQGRSSGSYTIRGVSVAERDTSANEGDVIDSTWSQVTFDGASWTDSTTVSQGAEKLSDPVAIDLKPGTDYYVTLKIESPSVYLNPPSGYRELYFYSADHTTDVDWSGNGHSVTQDFHALTKIYAYAADGDTTTIPAPDNLVIVD